MNRFASVLGFAVLTVFLGCSSAETSDGVDEGASTEGPVTRCGPPKAPAAVRAQSSCAEPSDVEAAPKAFILVTGTEGEGSVAGRFDFQVGVDVRGSKTYYVFSDNSYASQQDAQRGAMALLRVGIDAKNYERAQEDGQQYLAIKSPDNHKVIARTTYVKDGDVKRVINSVRKALTTAEFSNGTPDGARWKANYQARIFSLAAANNQTILESARVGGSSNGSFEDALFDAHELAAKDADVAARLDPSQVCKVFDMGPEDTWPTESFRIVMDPPGFRYQIAQIVGTDQKTIATSTTQFTTCRGAVEGIQTVTRLLKTMPRG